MVWSSPEAIKHTDVRKLVAEVQLVPQAILSEDISELARRAQFELVSSYDDLDEFEGAGFQLANVPFAIMHYRGHPEHTSTLYLPFEIKDVDAITRWIERIVRAMRIPSRSVQWQRKDTPEL